MEWIIAIENKWVGVSLGGGMNGNLLVLAWPWKGGIVSSPRFTA